MHRQEFLMHHGVKGMKWGERRAQKRANKAEYKSEMQEYRKNKSAAKEKFYNDKMESVYKTALKDPQAIINVYARHGYDTVPSNMLVTGREFVEGAKMGKIMDARYTDVYAYSNKGKDGKTGYTYNENFNARYVAPPKPTRDRT